MDIIFGFDLGDGETVISYILCDEKFNLKDRKYSINHTNAESHQTVYYKSLNGSLSFEYRVDTREIYSNFKKQPTSLKKAEYNSFAEQIMDYCNLCFNTDILRIINERIKADEIKKIVFCIGHPTNWTKEDVKMYKDILAKSYFGQPEIIVNSKVIPCSFMLEKESRAAMLHYQNTLENYTQKKNRLLIDIGSSTIDITAVLGNQNISIFNSGHNYLGARILDYILRDYILSETIEKKYPEVMDIFVKNNLARDVFLIDARKAKETVFDSIKNGLSSSARIDNRDIDKPIYIKIEEFKEILATPIKDTLLRYKLCKNDCAASLRQETWEDLFKEFLTEQKNELNSMGFKVDEIIFSGNASLMYFVPAICEEVFGLCSENIKYDQFPGIAIANGLVLCAITNAKSNVFTKEANELIRNKTPEIIEKYLPDFASILSSVLSDYVSEITYNELIRWKHEYITTLKEVKEIITTKCDSSSIKARLRTETVKKQIKKWYSSVFVDLNYELQNLAKNYNVNFELKKDIVTIPDISIPASVDNTISNFAFGIIDTSIGCVLDSENSLIGSMFAFVLQSIVLIIEFIVEIFGAIVSGLLSLLGIDLKLPSEVLAEKMEMVNLPGFIRKKIKDEDLKNASKAGTEKIQNQIETLVNENKFKNELEESISKSFEEELKNTIKQIQYIIESRTNSKVTMEDENLTNDENTNSLSLRDQIAQRLKG